MNNNISPLAGAKEIVQLQSPNENSTKLNDIKDRLKKKIKKLETHGVNIPEQRLLSLVSINQPEVERILPSEVKSSRQFNFLKKAKEKNNIQEKLLLITNNSILPKEAKIVLLSLDISEVNKNKDLKVQFRKTCNALNLNSTDMERLIEITNKLKEVKNSGERTQVLNDSLAKGEISKIDLADIYESLLFENPETEPFDIGFLLNTQFEINAVDTSIAVKDSNPMRSNKAATEHILYSLVKDLTSKQLDSAAKLLDILNEFKTEKKELEKIKEKGIQEAKEIQKTDQENIKKRIENLKIQIRSYFGDGKIAEFVQSATQIKDPNLLMTLFTNALSKVDFDKYIQNSNEAGKPELVIKEIKKEILDAIKKEAQQISVSQKGSIGVSQWVQKFISMVMSVFESVLKKTGLDAGAILKVLTAFDNLKKSMEAFIKKVQSKTMMQMYQKNPEEFKKQLEKLLQDFVAKDMKMDLNFIVDLTQIEKFTEDLIKLIEDNTNLLDNSQIAETFNEIGNPKINELLNGRGQQS